MELYLMTVIKEFENDSPDCASWIYSSFESALTHYNTEVTAAKEVYNYGDKCENEITTDVYRYFEVFNPEHVGRTTIILEQKKIND